MRRFEFVEGTSQKFWEVGTDGAVMTVRFGRIGTQGQEKAKEFTNTAAAVAEMDKLIREKTGKGYTEAGASASTPAKAATPVAPKAKPPAEPSPAAAPQAPPAAAAPAAPPAAKAPAPTAIPMPSGTFAWTPELRNEIPDVRGIRSRAVSFDVGLLLRSAPAFTDDPHTQQQYASLASLGVGIQGIVQAMTSPPATAAGTLPDWDVKAAKSALAEDRLRQPDVKHWATVLHNCARYHSGERDRLQWAVNTALALHGPAFFLQAYNEALKHTSSLATPWGPAMQGMETVRKVLQHAPDAEYVKARDVADTMRGQVPAIDALTCFLFPAESEWAEETIDAIITNNDTWGRWGSHLWSCAYSLEFAAKHFHTTRYWLYASYYGLRFASLLLVERFGNDAIPVIGSAIDVSATKDWVKECASLLGHFPDPRVVPVLVDRLEHKEVRAPLDRLADAWPALCLKVAVERAGALRSRPIEAFVRRLAVAHGEVVPAVMSALAPADADRFTRLLGALEGDEADSKDLPPVLREPPWLSGKRAEAVPELELAPIDSKDSMNWPEGLKQQWTRNPGAQWRLKELKKSTGKVPLEKLMLKELRIPESAWDRVLAGGPVTAEDFPVEDRWNTRSPEWLVHLPEKAALAVWEGMPAAEWYSYSGDEIGIFVTRLELKALKGLARYAQASPEDGLRLALPFRSASIAPTAAHALRNLKKAKPHAMAWLKAHAEVTALTLIPAAFATPSAARDNAQNALLWLNANGQSASVEAALDRHGKAAREAFGRLLARDPLLEYPSRMPKLAAFFVPGSMQRPRLRDGGMLSAQATQHLASMLAISALDKPYAGLAPVQDACDPESLADFAWDLFEAWMGAGGSSKDGWAFQALAHLGNDESARRLAPLIREWPGQAAHARAVLGLDVLATIGTDVALMLLNGIAQKAAFKGLKERANEKINAIAEARGLTAEELGDRLVPTLGLDETGTLRLDFGPRQFGVGFDEQLKPYVRDASGTRIKDLPKPAKTDDAAMSSEAVDRYKQLKKDARTIATDQVTRLERAMCNRRRWKAVDFRLFFLEHPLMRHLAQRLVWGVYDGDKRMGAARVAEDLTLADSSDAHMALPDSAEVGIAHPLELPDDMARRFGEVFADYEILQPFRQLGREVFALTEAERGGTTLKRFEGKLVATGSVMGLTSKGWRRGQPQDAGWVGWFLKPLPGGLEATLSIDPGLPVGDTDYEPQQKLGTVELALANTYDDAGKRKFDQVDAILTSELLRDLDLMSPVEKK